VLICILLALGLIIVWLFILPCSPWTVWKNGSCVGKPKAPKSDCDQSQS
jgi:hypothetical protein